MEFSSHRFVHVGLDPIFRTAMGGAVGSLQHVQHRRHRTNNDGMLPLPEKKLVLLASW